MRISGTFRIKELTYIKLKYSINNNIKRWVYNIMVIYTFGPQRMHIRPTMYMVYFKYAIFIIVNSNFNVNVQTIDYYISSIQLLV
jgi:hypothetical protein